jgi:hypothetical protein
MIKKPTSSLLTHLLLAAWFFCLCGYFINSSMLALTNFPLDDAWIHQVYAHALALGHGFAYNTHQQETGFSSPLFVVLCAPLEWLSTISIPATVIAIKCMNALFGLICVFLVFAIAKDILRSRVLAYACASLFSFSSIFLFSLFSGMETPLLVMLWLLSCYLLLHQRYLRASWVIGLCCVTRAEALILVPGFYFIYYWSCQKNHHQKPYTPYLICLAPFALWLLFCFFSTGYLLPNTFYAKAHMNWATWLNNLHQLLFIFARSDFSQSLLFYLITASGLILFWQKRTLRHNILIIMLMITPLLYLLGIISSRLLFSWGYFSRRYVNPALILLNAAFSISFFSLYHELISANAWAMKKWLVALALALPFYSCLWPTLTMLKAQKQLLARACLSIYYINVRAGLWISEHTPKNAVIGVNDAGAIRYFGRRTTIDLMGLNNQWIAHKSQKQVPWLKRIHWLVIFPSWLARLQENPYFNQIDFAHFKAVNTMTMPAHLSYVICTPLGREHSLCPIQNKNVISQREPIKRLAKINTHHKYHDTTRPGHKT